MASKLGKRAHSSKALPPGGDGFYDEGNLDAEELQDHVGEEEEDEVLIECEAVDDEEEDENEVAVIPPQPTPSKQAKLVMAQKLRVQQYLEDLRKASIKVKTIYTPMKTFKLEEFGITKTSTSAY
jgi:hypothetical protein